MGLPGDTAKGLRNRMRSELENRVREGFETVIVIAIGINDSALEDNEERFSPKTFEENIHSLIAIGKQFTCHIVMVGLNPVNESLVNPLPNGSGIAFRNSRVELFNSVLEKTAAAKGLPFVDVWGRWGAQDHRALPRDGLHPNDAGHALNADLVNGYLQKLITLE